MIISARDKFLLTNITYRSDCGLESQQAFREERRKTRTPRRLRQKGSSLCQPMGSRHAVSWRDTLVGSKIASTYRDLNCSTNRCRIRDLQNAWLRPKHSAATERGRKNLQARWSRKSSIASLSAPRSMRHPWWQSYQWSYVEQEQRTEPKAAR